MKNELEKAFFTFNKYFFQNKLKSVKFILSPSEKYVLHLRLTDVIEIGSGFADVTPREILDELLHIMVHLDNQRLQIDDFTHNQYHRKEFGEKALQLGMIVVWHKTRGWGLTFSDQNSAVVKSATKIRWPTKASSECLEQCYKSIKLTKSSVDKIRKELVTHEKPPKIFQLKYVCSCDPPVIIRSGRRPDGPNPLDVSCNICGAKFVAMID